MNDYTDAGYDNRNHYLECLAEEYDLDTETVLTLASLLGKSEDFDGLIAALEDMQ